MEEKVLTEKDNNESDILKCFGVLNKYATEKTAMMSFDEMKNIAIKKHVVEKYGKIS